MTMKVLGIRYCSVLPEVGALAGFFDALGLARKTMPDDLPKEFSDGAIFPAGDSWIELWPQGPGMPAGTMLQIVVDDADAFAEHARRHGLDPQGPQDAHGERIYFVQAPTGLQISFQSALASTPG
jgi:hypothetical protein